MNKVVDITHEADLADFEASKVDFKLQYGIPDLERLLRAAWKHGYMEALLRTKNVK